MQSDYHDPVARERDQRRELRAGIDVIFEALSHIQASLETSSEEEREESYRTFKEALYDRLEHLIEKRRKEDLFPEEAQVETAAENGAAEQAGPSTEEGIPDESGTAGQDSSDADTLEKLWPSAAEEQTRGGKTRRHKTAP
ncbi:MAG: hypothetical protein ABEL97_10470 [Salinibacter sp.]